MKKLFLLFCIAGTLAVTAQENQTPVTPTPAPDPNAPEMKWESTTIDYGTVTKGDESNATRLFKFTNTGKSPLIITNCLQSCGCTIPNWPHDPIMPGKSAEIKVHYAVERVGHFTKTVTVNSNSTTPNQIITITGTVVDPNAGKPEPSAVPATLPVNNNPH